ncbi:DUF7507 domain-containing protein, partial [Pararhodonellum marinum]
ATVNAVTDNALEVTKTAATASYAAVGDLLEYTITVENTGNTTLTNIVVEDPQTGFNTTIATLAPGATESFNVSYTVTQADIDNGSFTNTATATAADGTTESDSATVNAVTDNSIELTKTAATASYAAVGDLLEYTITVENTGNTTLTNVVVEDPQTGLNTTIATLAPGATE